MKGSTKRLLSIFISIILLIGAMIVVSSFISPVYSEINNKKGEISEKGLVLEENRSLVDKVKTLISESNQAQGLQKNISKILPLSEGIPEAINQISGIASLNKLEINSVSSRTLAIEPSGAKLIKGLGVVSFNIQLSGTYESFKSFLENLETNIRIMNVNYLIVESKGEGLTNNFLYNLTVDAYYQEK